MMQIKTLVLVAGSTLALAGSVFGQSAEQRELLADASQRSSFQGGGTYSSDRGFNISDASGDNRLTIGGAAQFRYTINVRDEDSVGDTNDLTTGFSNPLIRLRASGNIGSRELSYKIQLNRTDGASSDDGSLGIDDAYAQYDYGNGFFVRFGQFNLPVVREVSVGAEGHLGADFSVATDLFGQGYSQGIMIGYQAEQFRVMGAFSDGAGTANTDFSSGLEADWAISLRAEGLVLGSGWERFNDYTSWRSTEGDNVLVGGAVHFQDGGETGGTADNQIFIYTLDASWEGPGYNVTGVFYGSNVEIGNADSTDNFGGTIQGGLFLADQWEVFARWDGLFLDDQAALAEDDNLHFAGVGVNYYVFADSNAAKFTAQLNYAFNGTGVTDGDGGFTSLFASTQNGFLGQQDDGELALLLQFQLIF